MIPAKCPRCKKITDHTSFSKDEERVECALPWPCAWTIRKGTCTMCGAKITSATNQSRSDMATSWTSQNTRLEMCETIEPLYIHNPSIDSRNHIAAVLIWHPFGKDETVRELVDAALGRLFDAYKESADKIVFVGEGIESKWVEDNSRVLNEVYEISKSIFSDAVGPYPSLKLPLAVNRYLREQFFSQKATVVHVWPMPFLDPQGYLPIGTDDELVRLWVNYSRNSINVESDNNEQ